MTPGPFQMMLKHWKKSLFFLTTSNTALWYTYDYSITNDVMKTSCLRATKYGDQKLKHFDGRTRHITVILNPVAGKRKSRKLYTKWVEPLLNLAGIKVSLIETESPNQAFELMKIMSNCDGVAIVGGDGTVHEALNGLLNRIDSSNVSREFPIGIMPTGQYNSIARYLHQSLVYRNQKEFLIQSTMRLIEGTTEIHDVLKIIPLEEELKNNEKPPIYALRDVRYGKYQDNFVKTSGFLFYQTKIKPFWLKLQRSFSGKFCPPRIEAVSYTKPCDGCSRCHGKHRLKDTEQVVDKEPSANRRWWSMLAPIQDKSIKKPSDEELRELELAKNDNPDCDRWFRVVGISDVTDFRACMMGDKKVRLSLGLFGEYTPSETLEAQDVRLKVAADLDREYNLANQERLEEQKSETKTEESNNENESEDLKKKLQEEEERKTKFLIDGQITQAHSIEISTINKAVTIFTGPMKIID